MIFGDDLLVRPEDEAVFEVGDDRRESREVLEQDLLGSGSQGDVEVMEVVPVDANCQRELGGPSEALVDSG